VLQGCPELDPEVSTNDRPLIDSTARSDKSPSTSNYCSDASTTICKTPQRSTNMTSREIWRKINRKKRERFE